MSCQSQCSEARDGEPCRFCLFQYADEFDADMTTATSISMGDESRDDSTRCSPTLNGGRSVKKAKTPYDVESLQMVGSLLVSQ
mgnify:FL=1|jgi:hypothetical protein